MYVLWVFGVYMCRCICTPKHMYIYTYTYTSSIYIILGMYITSHAFLYGWQVYKEITSEKDTPDFENENKIAFRGERTYNSFFLVRRFKSIFV